MRTHLRYNRIIDTPVRCSRRLRLDMCRVLCALVLFLLLAADTTNALMIRATIGDLTSGADLIIDGTVSQTTSRWNDENTSIITEAVINVDELLKGHIDGDQVVVLVPGGTVENVTQRHSVMPIYTPGERSIYFLRSTTASQITRGTQVDLTSSGPWYEVYYHFQGKLDVQDDSVDGRCVALLKDSIYTHLSDHEETRFAAEDGEVLLVRSPTYVINDRWQGSAPNVGYKIQSSFTSAEISSIQAAAATWSGAGTPFRFTYLGTYAGSGGYLRNDVNEVTLSSSLSPSVLALNTWWVVNGYIVESDIDFNANILFSTTSPPLFYDLQSVALHEFGHTLSLGHSAYADAVMWPTIGIQQSKRSLHYDDINGIFALYPPPIATRIIRLTGDLAFGDVIVGQTATRTLTIHNDGNSTLTVSGISYPSGFSGNWNGTIAAGESMDVTVSFSPIATQQYEGNLTVDSDRTSGISTRACSGTGIPVPTRIIRLTGDLAFGNVSVDGHAKSKMSIHNDGNSTLNVSGFDYPSGFSGDWGGGTIPAGESRDMHVIFHPTDRLIYGGNVNVESDKTDGISTKECSGRGILVSDILNFNHIASTTSHAMFEIAGFNGSEYILESCTDLFLGRWSQHSVVTVSNGWNHFEIPINPDVEAKYYRVLAPTPDVHGTMNISPDLSFGEVNVGNSATNSFYIENTGSALLTISNIVFPEGFSGVWDAAPIQAGENREVTVTFTPLQIQGYSGSIHVISDRYAGSLSISCSGAGWGTIIYLVIDLSAGPSASSYTASYMSSPPSGGWTDEYKTTKLVLRRIPAGTFIMGSPESELGRWSDETQHQVTLTQDFYIGVFPVTQRQWERVMGDWPSFFNNTTHRNARPVERVSYNMIRGSDAGSGWPTNSNVDVTSFMGRLRSRTGRAFDLPTESQWEYACRAGTTTALNSGKNITTAAWNTPCPNMDEVGRYRHNHLGGYSGSSSVGTEGGTAKVGSYQPNSWGLYDMHGNVWEWCLDWNGGYPGTVANPKGPSSGSGRGLRGGGWAYSARYCRSAYRFNDYPSNPGSLYGFRVALPQGQP